MFDVILATSTPTVATTLWLNGGLQGALLPAVHKVSVKSVASMVAVGQDPGITAGIVLLVKRRDIIPKLNKY
jgi:hypothetical protein